MKFYFLTTLMFLFQHLTVEGASCKSNSDCGQKEACATLFGTCSRIRCEYDVDCFSNEFCNKQKARRKYGDCAAKTIDGSLCVVDIE